MVGFDWPEIDFIEIAMKVPICRARLPGRSFRDEFIRRVVNANDSKTGHVRLRHAFALLVDDRSIACRFREIETENATIAHLLENAYVLFHNASIEQNIEDASSGRIHIEFHIGQVYAVGRVWLQTFNCKAKLTIPGSLINRLFVFRDSLYFETVAVEIGGVSENGEPNVRVFEGDW